MYNFLMNSSETSLYFNMHSFIDSLSDYLLKNKTKQNSSFEDLPSKVEDQNWKKVL